MYEIIIAVVLLFTMDYVEAGGWTRTFALRYNLSPSNKGAKIFAADDENVVVCGNSLVPEVCLATHVAEFDPIGNMLWEKEICTKTTSHNAAYTLDGNIVVVGSKYILEPPIPPAPPIASTLLKISIEGDSLWFEEHFYDEFPPSSGIYHTIGSNVVAALDGGYLIAGYTNNGRPPCDNDIYSPYLYKTDSAGNFLWGHLEDLKNPTPDFYYHEMCGRISQGICQTDDGHIYLFIAGSWGGGVDYESPVMVKLDENGNVLWRKHPFDMPPPVPAWDYAKIGVRDVIMADDGNFVITGGTPIPGMGLGDAMLFVSKMDTAGTVLWSHEYLVENMPANEMGKRIKAVPWGGYIIDTGRDIIKTDDEGEMEWMQRHPYKLEASDVLPAPDGSGYYRYGKATLDSLSDEWGGNYYKLFLLKTDLEGNCRPQAAFDYELDETGGLTLINQSQGADDYVWDFGGGDTSSMTEPMHTYLADGVYQLCLYANNLCGTDTLCQSLSVEYTGLEAKPSPIIASLQQSGGRLHLKAQVQPKAGNKHQLALFDCLGKQILAQQLSGTNINHEISTAHLASGIYLLHLNSGGHVWTRKVFIP